jgi:nitrogenase molybdenum-iron protein NifN
MKTGAVRVRPEPENVKHGAASLSAYASTTNACAVCAPLGASLAFRGIEGAVPYIHGSQGCATYMRRYIISHYREPMDIASSSLGEKQAVFGGGPNLKKGILNVMRKYAPSLVGVATTCLTETIGDDVPGILLEFKREFGDLGLPEIVAVSTPSYSGTHSDGWHAAVAATVETLSKASSPGSGNGVNIFPGMVSCADMEHIKDIVQDFGLAPTLLPDISETLDGPALAEYRPVPPGGTPLSSIRAMPKNLASIELGRTLSDRKTGAAVLEKRFGVERTGLGLPIGLRETDALMEALSRISGRPVPRRHLLERGRLLDAMADGHKYLAGKRVAVYGEEDLTIGLVAFLAETGAKPVLAATGGRSAGFAQAAADVCEGLAPVPEIIRGADFHEIADKAKDLSPEILIGHGKGQRTAREWGIPLVRAGFPIHDRFGAQRLSHTGYKGALQLYDRIVNALLKKTQESCSIGYGYL